MSEETLVKTTRHYHRDRTNRQNMPIQEPEEKEEEENVLVK